MNWIKNILKKSLAAGLISLALFSSSAFAQNIVTSSGVWYRSGSAMLLNPSTLTVGESGSPIADGEFTALTVGTLTVSGIVSTGDIDMDGYNIIMDTDGDTAFVNDRDGGVDDDEIDIKIATAVDFTFSANAFTAVSGSVFATDTINETTSANGVTIDGVSVKDRGLILTPSSTATQNVIDMTPSGALAADTIWNGINMNGAALDPSATGAEINGIEIDLSGVSEVNDPIIHGIHSEVPFGQNALHVVEGIIHVDTTMPSTAESEFEVFDINVDSTLLAATSVVHLWDASTVGFSTGRVIALTARNDVEAVVQQVVTSSTPSQTEFAGRKTSAGTVWADGIDTVEFFVVNSDELYIGSSAVFANIEVIMSSAATKDTRPTFHYNTAADTWTEFFPTDETSGFIESGNIEWELADISGTWTGDGDPGAGDTTAGYWIKIIRTRTADPGTPTATTMKTGTVVEYLWDSAGDLTVNSVNTLGIDNDGTITTLLGVAGDYIQIGDAAGTSHGLNSEDDLQVTGEFEVDGAAYFDATTLHNSTHTMNDNADLAFGSSADVRLDFSTNQLTANSLVLGLDNVSQTLLIVEAADKDVDFGHAAEINPAVFVHSADATSILEYLKLQHDGTAGILESGSGSLILRAAGNIVTVEDNVQIALGTSSDSRFLYSTLQTPDSLMMGVPGTTNALAIVETADVAFDFAHTLQVNPTVFFHSENQSTVEWLGITHDQTDGLITTGAGGLMLTPTTDVFISDTHGLVVGNSAQVASAEVTSEFQILGTTETDGSATVYLGSTTDALAPTLNFVKSAAAAIGTHTTAVADDEELGKIKAYGTDGTDADTLVAEIGFFVDHGSPAAGAIGGEIILSTANTAGGVISALTISSAQLVTVENDLSVDGRLLNTQGVDVASATNLVLGTDGNVFEITGTTKIDLISNDGWQEGACLKLVFNESVTVDDGTATSGANTTMILAGGADFSATADDMLELCLTSTTAGAQGWREMSRSAN